MRDEFSAGLIIGIVFGIGFGCFVIGGMSTNSWKSEAVEKGHAEYVLQGSKAVWQWKEIKEPAK